MKMSYNKYNDKTGQYTEIQQIKQNPNQLVSVCLQIYGNLSDMNDPKMQILSKQFWLVVRIGTQCVRVCTADLT